MLLEIAKWRDDAISPVLFKIDDLANIYIKKSKSKELQIGEDWGQCAFDTNSMWDFLSKNLLNKFSHIKTTFFLVTKKRTSMTTDGSYDYNQTMDGDQKFINFLKYLHNHPNVELSYHGTTHGIANKEVASFKQEWETFKTLDEALTTIKEGKELFKSVLSTYPNGGKYCGYKEGSFGKDSIEQSKFKWWCFHEDNLMWDKGITTKYTTYDLKFIQGVVNIPTTVDASNLSLKIINKIFTRKYLKSIYLYLTKNTTVEKHIQSLLNNKEVISIYEHTSPYMTNDTIQYPNIVSDIDNLNLIFSLLAKEDVWYATCNEAAEYFIDRSNTSIKMINKNKFQLISNKKLNSELTLIFPFEGEEFSLYSDENKFIKKFSIKNNKLYITHNFEVNQSYQLKN